MDAGGTATTECPPNRGAEWKHESPEFIRGESQHELSAWLLPLTGTAQKILTETPTSETTVKVCPNCYKNRRPNYEYTGTTLDSCVYCGSKLEVIRNPHPSPVILVQKICRTCKESYLQPSGLDTFCPKCGNKLESEREQSQIISATLKRDPYKVDRAFHEAQSTAALYQSKAAVSEDEVRRLLGTLQLLQGEVPQELASKLYNVNAQSRLGLQVLQVFLNLWNQQDPQHPQPIHYRKISAAVKDAMKKEIERRVEAKELDGRYAEKLKTSVDEIENSTVRRRLNELAKLPNPDCKGYPHREGVCRCWCAVCVKPDTIIVGDNRPIRELSDGNLCVGQKSVQQIHGRFEREYSGVMKRITASGLLPVECTPDHPILVCSGNGNVSEPYWKFAGDIRMKKSNEVGDYLVLPILSSFIDSANIDLRKFTGEHGLIQLQAKKRPFSFPITYDTAWLIGLYIAEGFPGGERGLYLSIGKHEIELAQNISRIVTRLGYPIRSSETRTSLQMCVASRILERAFKSWCGSGAANKHLPDFALFHSDARVLRGLLDGYLAGDGCAAKSYDGTVYQDMVAATVSKLLALQLQLLCARLGLFLQIHEKKTQPTTMIEGRLVNQKPVFQLRLSLSHARNKRVRKRSSMFMSPVWRIENRFYRGMVNNLETDDHTYLVSNAVVHNCLYGFRVPPLFWEDPGFYALRLPKVGGA
jgi:hypothetical protein